MSAAGTQQDWDASRFSCTHEARWTIIETRVTTRTAWYLLTATHYVVATRWTGVVSGSGHLPATSPTWTETTTTVCTPVTLCSSNVPGGTIPPQFSVRKGYIKSIAFPVAVGGPPIGLGQLTVTNDSLMTGDQSTRTIAFDKENCRRVIVCTLPRCAANLQSGNE